MVWRTAVGSTLCALVMKSESLNEAVWMTYGLVVDDCDDDMLCYRELKAGRRVASIESVSGLYIACGFFLVM